jgi:Mlc titration factor MtfA (ptsG expression regulator)
MESYDYISFFKMSFLIGVILIFLIVWVLVFYRKRKIVHISRFPEAWKTILNKKVKVYEKLPSDQKPQFEKDMIEFMEGCRITGVDFELNDEDRMLVAASAVIPIFGFPDWKYKNLKEVLIYPSSFNKNYETAGSDRNIGGMVGWGPMNRTMILSRESLHQGFENEYSKSNVGIHEFVHLIDKMDGTIDGIPDVLMRRSYTIPWLKMIHDEMKRIHRGRSDINPYGATNEAEFFSVVSEYFFNQPQLLAKKHPELYQMLENVFHQDPAILE